MEVCKRSQYTAKLGFINLRGEINKVFNLTERKLEKVKDLQNLA